MEAEKMVNQYCAIQRALGIIEGVACSMEKSDVRQMLYTATEMIDEAVVEITKEGGGDV